jgi:hypothetical protein
VWRKKAVKTAIVCSEIKVQNSSGLFPAAEITNVVHKTEHCIPVKRGALVIEDGATECEPVTTLEVALFRL